ncbi:8096_t:CDS:2 [Acaulospora morrowiae]|uniref:8096_t:CDS:1 n=1 Tax=Acaulospora morrowiae TaxID=94023 RepID=A0A9N9B013_9GLOM|nr:8096_t:CDS:2 [Acaulospora morrowiae]
MRFYENGNLYQYLDYAMGTLCGETSSTFFGEYPVVENEAESIDTRISDVEVVDGTPEVYIKLISSFWDHDPMNRPNASELSEEKKFADLESNSFTCPEIHPQAICTSQPLNFKLSFEAFYACVFKRASNTQTVSVIQSHTENRLRI